MSDIDQNTNSENEMNRQERRIQKREEQKRDIDRQKRNRTVRRVLIWGATLAVLIGAVYGISQLPSNVTSSGNGVLTVPVSDSDNILGPVGAPITLVEYSDYQCPACGAFYPVIKKLLAEPDAQGRVRLVYRNFPLSQHPNAQIAARAAEAAKLQGKFWEMHDKLFENQNIWSGMSNAGAKQKFISYAKDLGLNEAKFTSDMDSSQVKDKIQADTNGGLASRVDATPTFFINGIKMPPPSSYDELKSFVLNGVPSPIK